MDTEEVRLPTALVIPLIQIVVAVFLFMALLNGQRDLTVLGLLVVTLMAGTKIWSRLSPAKIHHLTLLDKPRAFAGETVTFTTQIRNAKILPVLARLTASFSTDLPAAEGSAGLRKSCSLLWYQETRFTWSLTALRRGVYRIGPSELAVGDLFGFYSTDTEPAAPREVIVYPRLIPLRPIRLPRRDLFGIPGVKGPIEDPIYVYGTREYQSGRPARYIHWKASARFARLQEKICEPAAQEKILLIVAVDRFHQHQAKADFEKILEVAASAAVRFDQAGFAVGLVTNGELKGGGSLVLPISRGAGQMPKILETLARVQMTPAADMGDLLQRGLNLPWGTTGLSLSYDLGGCGSEIVAFFHHRGTPLVSIVCRPGTQPGENQGTQSALVLALEEVSG